MFFFALLWSEYLPFADLYEYNGAVFNIVFDEMTVNLHPFFPIVINRILSKAVVADWLSHNTSMEYKLSFPISRSTSFSRIVSHMS